MMFKDYTKEKLDKALKRLFNTWGSFNLSSTDINVETFLTLSQESIDKAYNDFAEEVKIHNTTRLEIAKTNQQIKEAFLKIVGGIEGINPLIKSRMYKSNGKLYAHWDKAISDLQNYAPSSRDKRSLDSTFDFTFNYGGKDYIVRTKLTAIVQSVTDKIKFINEKTLEQDSQYIKAVSYIKEHSLDSSWCVTKQDFYLCANEHAKEEYRNSMTDQEIDVTHSDGDGCEWIVGEHRCSCGNNRYYLEVDGDFIKGFYSYSQWC